MQVRPGLANAIDVVRKRIQQIRDRKEIIGEQNTKAALIDPILIALGWDLQEIDEVRREFRRKPQDNPVDYALFLSRTECLFIEAKSLEKDLNDRKWISQNLSYATVVGVCWCALTNGGEYRIYNSHAAVDVEQKLFRSVSVSDAANANYVADTLHLLSKEQMQGRLLDELWKVHFIDGNVSRSIEALLANEDSGLIRLVCKKAKGVTPSEVRASLKRAKIRIDFPVVPAVASGPRPRSVVGGHLWPAGVAAFGDLDNNGFVDMVMTVLGDRSIILRNRGNGNHWLAISLICSRSNRDGFGARINVNGQWSYSSSAGSYLSASDERLHFGLGAVRDVPVEVLWPSGARQVLNHVSADQFITVREPR